MLHEAKVIGQGHGTRDDVVAFLRDIDLQGHIVSSFLAEHQLLGAGAEVAALLIFNADICCLVNHLQVLALIGHFHQGIRDR